MGDAKDRALRLLAVRSRSREELRRRLRRAGYAGPEVVAALEDLEAVGLIDDDAFARELARHKLRGQGYGRRGALAALRSAGVDPSVAERALDQEGDEDEEARAEEVARARIPRLRGLEADVAYRRLVGFLLRRGFEGEVARAVCRRVLGSA